MVLFHFKDHITEVQLHKNYDVVKFFRGLVNAAAESTLEKILKYSLMTSLEAQC